MSTYYQIFGGKINVVASDPANPIKGQVWFNSGTPALKYQALTVTGTWATGGNLGTARDFLAGAGTQTSGLGFGGYTAPPVVNSNATEEYNGTSWTAGGNLGTARRSLAGCGLQTVAAAFGGYATATSNATEEYDGSTWTAGGNLGTARYGLAGAGTQTSALGFGGSGPSASTEEYNGSAWTAGGNLGTARRYLAGAGTQTAGLAFGGVTSTAKTTATEEYSPPGLAVTRTVTST